jgi:predicted RNA-binding protein
MSDMTKHIEVLQALQVKAGSFIFFSEKIEALKEEKRKLESKIKEMEQFQKNFKQDVINAMLEKNITQINIGDHTATIQDTQGIIDVDDEEAVSYDYKKEKIVVSVDKAKAKKFYKKSGVLPAGFKFSDGKTIVIRSAKQNTMDLTTANIENKEEEENDEI